jgi:hypothetical protein
VTLFVVRYSPFAHPHESTYAAIQCRSTAVR